MDIFQHKKSEALLTKHIIIIFILIINIINYFFPLDDISNNSLSLILLLNELCIKVG